MRTYLFSILLTTLLALNVQSQCDRQIKMKCEKAFKLHADGSTAEEQDIAIDITLTKDSIRLSAVTPQGSQVEISGPLKEKDCKMNSSFSEGTFAFKSDATKKQDYDVKEMKLKFSLEAKDGKLKLFGEKDVPAGEDPEKMYFEIKESRVL